MTLKEINEEIKKDPDKEQVLTNDLACKENTEMDKTDFDDLLSSAGEFGLYQVIVFFSMAPFYTFLVFIYYTQLFLTEASPNHWCWIPELENLTVIERRNLAIPRDDSARFGYSQCEAYDANWTDVLTNGIQPNSTWTTSCHHGWEFNETEIPYPTISSELGWVCEKDSYQATAQAIFFFGSISGGFLIGWIADRFGRIPAIIISNLFGCVGGFVTIFARDFTEFAICRFITGLAYDNCMTMAFLLALEYVAPKYRTLIANLSFAIFYTIASTGLPWLVLACGHWKIFSLATSLPLALVVLTPLFMPESARWLLSKGRVDTAVKKILTIGRINKKEISEKMIEQFKTSALSMKQEEKGSVLELIRRPLLRKMFICVCLVYSFCALVFDALIRNVGQLQFDFFVSFSVISLTEFPSMLITAFVMDWTGRRWLVSVTLMLTCVFSIFSIFIGIGLPSVICAVAARFSLNMAYGTVMQWGAEMLPTTVRGSGLAIIHICGFVGYVLAPYIVYLETFIHWLPLVLMGAFSGFGAIIAMFLPETTKKIMPHTFDDAEELIRQQKFWEMPCFRRKTEQDLGHINSSFEMQ